MNISISEFIKPSVWALILFFIEWVIVSNVSKYATRRWQVPGLTPLVQNA